jgi:hypothetical protein
MSLLSNTAWLMIGALAGYAIVMRTNPVRESLRDGWRAIGRYPTMWFVLGCLGFAHAAFNLGIRAYMARLLPEADRPIFQWMRASWRDPDLWLVGSPESLWWLPMVEFVKITRESLFPAIESVAGLFHNITSTFPVSALIAPLLLLPWSGRMQVLRHGLRRRFGGFAWFIYFALLISAIAAIAKPIVYATPEVLPPLLWTHWGQVVVSLAFAFEYLLGVGVQIFLILTAFAWIRGLSFQREAMVDVAIRRFAVVLPWSGLILLLSLLIIDFPLMLKNFPATATYFVEADILEYWTVLARGVLAGVIIVGAGVQVRLALHSSSWRQAWREHTRMMLTAWWPFGWFLVISLLHFFLWTALTENVSYGVGEGTALWVAWQLISPWITGTIGAWLLASWVCVYKRYVRPASDQPAAAEVQLA